MNATTEIQWTENRPDLNASASARTRVARTVVQAVDRVSEAIALFVHNGPLNLSARCDTCVARECGHQPGLFSFDPQVWKQRSAEQLGTAPEQLDANLTKPMAVLLPKVGLVMRLNLASVPALAQPFDDINVGHRDAHDWVHGLVANRTNSGDKDRPFAVNEASHIRALGF